MSAITCAIPPIGFGCEAIGRGLGVAGKGLGVVRAGNASISGAASVLSSSSSFSAAFLAAASGLAAAALAPFRAIRPPRTPRAKSQAGTRLPSPWRGSDKWKGWRPLCPAYRTGAHRQKLRDSNDLIRLLVRLHMPQHQPLLGGKGGNHVDRIARALTWGVCGQILFEIREGNPRTV